MWEYIAGMNSYQSLSVGIASISLIVSLITLYRTRKTLTVTWSKDLEVVDSGNVFFYDNNNEIQSYGPGFYLTLDIVNPSPHDIAYFDLRAFCPHININTYLLTRKSLLADSSDTVIYKTMGKDNIFKLDIPEKNYGVLKSNSFTRLDLFIVPNEHIDNDLLVTFKVAIKSKLFKDKFSVTNRKKYRPYGRNFKISGWEEMLTDKE